MNKILKYSFWLFLVNATVLTSVQAQDAVIASWSLNPNAGENVITDSKSNFTLTRSVSFSEGTYSGAADNYWPSLDLRDKTWMIEGSFKTEGEAASVMAIVGNRSALSGYTGWDFLMLKNGVLRFMVNSNNNAGKTLMSGNKRFDDGKEHQFAISWNTDKKIISMVIDKEFKYSTPWSDDLGENHGRIFFIGAQPTNGGGKVLPFKGELRNFTFKGILTKTATSQSKSIESIDKEMVAKTSVDATTLWVDAKTLTIQGMGWKSDVTDYTRLPNKYQSMVTPEVWTLSRHSAGISVHFVVSGTSFVSAKWTLKGNAYLPNMAPIGVNGLDLYVKLNGKWLWTGVGKPIKDILQQETIIKSGFTQSKSYECMLYLPLYTSLSALEIGFSPGAKVMSAPEPTKKPLVFYGTSILHGCSASRPGMPFASMLGRHFDVPIVNLGFSGNGLMEANFGDIMGEIEASAYIVDCLPNMANFTTQEITDRTLTLVRKLRKMRPVTPVVLVEDRNYAYANLSGVAVVNNRRAGLKAAYDILIKETTNLYYVEGDQLLGEDTEATIDGSHPTDLGMYRYFIAFEPVISKVLCCK